MGLPVAIMHVGSLYAVAAAAGCLVLAGSQRVRRRRWSPRRSPGVVVTAVIRLLAVVFDLSLPEQRTLYRRKVAVETGAIPIVKP